MLKIEDARERLQRMEDRRVEIEEQLRVAPDEEKDDLLLQYENGLDALEAQKKLFEDLEFQQLEVTNIPLELALMYSIVPATEGN